MPTKIIIRKRRATAERFIEKVDGLNLKMVKIPAGSFIMGAPETEAESQPRERPQHLVTVPEFCIAQTQITQVQWRIVAGYDQINQKLDPDPSNFKGGDRPVEKVSWLDAKEFCARLSEKTGRKYRLPTEAEWECACRATIINFPNPNYQLSEPRDQLSQSREARIIEAMNNDQYQPFHFGETLSAELANYCAANTYGRGVEGENRQQTTPVASFPANNFGLYDMHGNALEWCEDDYHSNYEDAPTDGSAWLGADRKNASKILRGGSWATYPGYCRSAARFESAPSNRNHSSRGVRLSSFSFRVVTPLS